jgi:hypothetical protein
MRAGAGAADVQDLVEVEEVRTPDAAKWEPEFSLRIGLPEACPGVERHTT